MTLDGEDSMRDSLKGIHAELKRIADLLEMIVKAASNAYVRMNSGGPQ
jgi:hypothetical protein